MGNSVFYTDRTGDVMASSDPITWSADHTGILVATLHMQKLLDEQVIEMLRKNILAQQESCADSHVVIDCSGVEYMSSAFFGTLITTDKRLKKAKKRFFVCAHPDVLVPMKQARLDTLFEMADSAEEALKQLQ